MTIRPIIELRGVSKRFARSLDFAEMLASRLGAPVRDTIAHAVNCVDLQFRPAEAVGLVGESGSGKSTLGRIIAGLDEPSEGDILLHGRNRATFTRQERRRARLATQMIFQSTLASLNPRLTVREAVGEAPRFHRLVAPADLGRFVDDMLRRVGLDPAYSSRYPHQLSGGQRQRLGIARALAVAPEFLICDEPVSALDVSIQAQIINLFVRLRRETNLSYLFISHDLSVIGHVADRILVMYLGRIIESAPTDALFATPNHPYTQSLLGEVPRLNQRHRQFAAMRGMIPSALSPPAGCHFHPRCPYAMERCRFEAPKLREIQPERLSACHLNDHA